MSATADNTLYEEAGDRSNALGRYLFGGRTRLGAARRALLVFDVAAVIPAGSTIESATVTLRLSRSEQAGATNVSLHRLLAAWGEADSQGVGNEGDGAPATDGDATWTHAFFDSTPWASGGADFASAASATTGVGTELVDYQWSAQQLADDVQSWLDAPQSEFGWIVLGQEDRLSTAKRFDSRENDVAENRPRLEVRFTPPTELGACCSAAGACSLVAAPGDECDGGFLGPETSCSPNPCAGSLGACCLPTATAACLDASASQCVAQGGRFLGSESACGSVRCPVVLEPFVDPLPIPPVAQPLPQPAATSNGSGAAATVYELSARQFERRLHRDLPATTLWGYADSSGQAAFPGPTIEASSGEFIRVVWKNDLRDASGELLAEHHLAVDTCPHGARDANARTVVHLHGAHTAAEFDGYPEDTILPGEQQVFDYPNEQLPATLWYHDHALGITRLNTYMGLLGFYLLRDPIEATLGLPDGPYEIPLAIADRTVRPDGSLSYPELWQEHFFGDKVLVNGVVWPYLEVARGKYRLRLLNASGSRTYTLALADGAPIVQIGSDGGLLAAPLERSEVTLAPAERADVVIDFEPYAAGTEIILRNSAPAPFPGPPGEGVVGDVMKFVVTDAAGSTAPLPETLRPLERLREQEAVVEREFVLERGSDDCSGSAWLINGLRWDDITEYPELGTTEVWRFVNRSGITHPMHMHLVMFQLLDRQAFELIDDTVVPTGSRLAPPPEELAWKDTVRVDPLEIVRVIARFEDYKGKFAYHCHIIEHEDNEMMRQFQTVACGDAVVDPTEDCDDGDATWSPGQSCNADCEVLACGDPGDEGGEPSVTDALFTLHSAVANVYCEECLCDVNDDGMVSATDALILLRRAIGEALPLTCQPCF